MRDAMARLGDDPGKIDPLVGLTQYSMTLESACKNGHATGHHLIFLNTSHFYYSLADSSGPSN
jgi:hypothetical protein